MTSGLALVDQIQELRGERDRAAIRLGEMDVERATVTSRITEINQIIGDIYVALGIEPPATEDRAVSQPRPPQGAPQRPAVPELELEAKVLFALIDGPLSPKEISSRTGITKYPLADILKRMVADRRVTKTGQRLGVKFWRTKT